MTRRRQRRRNEDKKKQVAVLALLFLLTGGVLFALFFFGPSASEEGEELPVVVRPDPPDAGEGETAPPEPPPPQPAVEVAAEQPQGRCTDEGFRKMAAQLFVGCQEACKATEEDNPVVQYPDEHFVQLFGKADDAGVSSFLFPFPSMAWITHEQMGDENENGMFDFDAQLKRGGYDGQIPKSARRIKKEQKDAMIGYGEFEAWLRQTPPGAPKPTSKFKRFIVLGNASKSGNIRPSPQYPNGLMSAKNRFFAFKRAEAALKLLRHKTLNTEEMEAEGDEMVAAGLDNVKQDINKLRDGLESKVPNRNRRSFNPKRGHIVNQAALIVALDCDLNKEIQEILALNED